MKFSSFFFLLLSLFFSTLSFSQIIPLDKKDVTPSFEEVWTKEFNQSLSSIEDIKQTKDGYIWIATNNGLFRYDGVRFASYSTSNTPQIKSNIINSIFETADGELLIGTNKGLISYRDGKFYHNEEDNLLRTVCITSLAMDNNNTLYIGTLKDGLLCRPRDQKLYTLNPLSKKVSINKLVYDNHILWIGTTQKGLVKFQNGKLEFMSKIDPVFSESIRSIYKDSKGTLWLGSSENGIIKYNFVKTERLTKSNGLTSNRILSITGDPNGSVWIGTAGGGLIKAAKDKFEVYTTKDGLNLDAIKSLLFDREGNFWVGTAGGGLNKMKQSNVVTYTMKNGLCDNYVWTMGQDTKGNIWLGTGDNGVTVITKAGLRTLNAQTGYNFNNVRTICCDSKGRVWLGTPDLGIFLLDRNKLFHFDTTNGLTDNHTRAIFEDSKGTIWVGSNNHLIMYKEGKFYKYLENGKPVFSGIRFITEDKNGNLYLASGSSGLYMMSKNSKKKNYSTKEGLPSKDVTSIHCDKNNVIWIATSLGLARLKDDKVSAIHFNNMFDNQLILHIMEDDYHYLWMSSFIGLLAANIDDMNLYADGKSGSIRCKIIGKEDGMLSTECNGANQNAGGKSKDGRLWFPTMNGFVTVDPEKFFSTKTLSPPNIAIDRFVVDDSTINIHNNNIEIQPGAYKFEFHYAALSYKNPNLNRYKYKLDGIDKDWIDVGNRTSVYYTNLPYGTYTFHIIASNSDGVWNSTGISLTFRILPKFYQTSTFIFFAAVGLIALVFVIYRWRINNLQKAKTKLQGIVEAQTRQLQEELLERKQNEIKLQESEEKLNFYIEGSKDCFWDWNIQSDIISFSQNAPHILGFKFEELPRNREEILKLIYPDDLDKFVTAINSCIQLKEPSFEMEFRLLSDQNQFKWIFDRGKIVEYDENNNPILIAGSITEITERKRNEDELFKAKKIESIGLLAGGIAHDFNNLLTAILGNISLIRIKLEKNDNKNLFKLLENSETASLRAKDLTQQLLTFSKGGQPIIKTMSLQKTIEDCIVFTLRGSKVKSHFNLPANLWLVDADEGQFGQVLQNLAVNALQAMPNGGNLYVSAQNIKSGSCQTHIEQIQNNDFVQIAIKDSGHGISKDNIDKIFDPYFTTKETGHGLGLATSYSIIKKHKGFLTVESEENSGTTFFVWLPKSSCNNKSESSETQEILYGKGKILIMDDEPLILELIKEMLVNLGYIVYTAENGEEAISIYKEAPIKEPFNLLILDLTVPGSMGGLETLENIRKINPEIKAIVTSGYSNDPVMSNYTSHGFNGVISKPYKVEEISRTIYCIIGDKK